MELKIILTLLTFFFFSLQPTFSLQTQSPSLQHEGAMNTPKKLSFSILPRKMRFTEKVKESDEARDIVSHKKKVSLPLGKKDLDEGKQDMVVGNKGTRQELMEEEVAFTMDYHRVRRRRPIHNKQVPVGP